MNPVHAPSAPWLAELARTLGPGGLWRPGQDATPDELAPYLIDWRRRYQGQALAIARPASTQEVAHVVRACAQHGVAIVPQGGNTSLVGGSVPDASGQQLVLNLQRLKQVREVDAANLSLTAEAGCTLHEVQTAAHGADLLFPLNLASQGSCTLGGNLASNAGGTQVLRYGTARELCLGLEVVTAQGEVWSGLSGLRKDNTGYDLRDLFIGSEGTLGIITAATLRLYPRPQGQCTALLACPDLSSAVALLQQARQTLDAGLTAFELMQDLPLDLVRRHQPQAAGALQSWATGNLPAWVVLIEFSSSESDEHASHRLQALLSQSHSQGLILDAVLASQQSQQQAMWRLREAIPLAERVEGLMVKHDIGLPTSAIPGFVTDMARRLSTRWPESRVVCFGHLGDGNLHYNVQPPLAQASGEAMLDFEREVNDVVFEQVTRLGGTISAEHGIGVLRREELMRRTSPVEMVMMRAIKQALDPQGLMNPGRVLSN
jgi:FAD/FMN-containing dehydrogenase